MDFHASCRFTQLAWVLKFSYRNKLLSFHQLTVLYDNVIA
ncbi:hypothetical protein SAMN03080601_00194 [Alkalitalea saponilacus]|uniref:Uncharacterized protein n=1 Tax=Alkalitalea saponilacus TaxID=889453 RepID=A0A1T5ABU4_9BACT|nr:hypothetical protein SAMN03080601_00194 [Alkalitalea saponilacus]